jgi:hypothetical protein
MDSQCNRGEPNSFLLESKLGELVPPRVGSALVTMLGAGVV